MTERGQCPTFDTAFPSDTSRCANCGGPAKRVELANPPRPGMWVQAFDGSRYVAERVAQLSDQDLWALASEIACCDMPVERAPDYRKALYELFGVQALNGEGTHHG